MLHIFGKNVQNKSMIQCCFWNRYIYFWFFKNQLLLTCYSLFLLLNVIKFEETVLKKLTKCNVHIVVTPIIVSVLKLLIIMCSCMYYSETCLLRSCFFTNKKWNFLSLKWLFCFIFQLFLHSNDFTSSPSYYNVCISNTLPHTDYFKILNFFFYKICTI